MSKVVPLAEMRGEDVEDTVLLRELADTARSYLDAMSWHEGIVAGYFGLGVGGIAGAFLFEVRPSSPSAPRAIWIVVGDVPPAYIAVDDAPNPATALDSYIGAMEDWVKAAKAGADVSKLIPLNVPATRENVLKLEKRLRFLDEEILADYADDLRD